MHVRTAALIAASVVSSGVVASAATAAGGPPLPQGVGGAKDERVLPASTPPPCSPSAAGTCSKGTVA
jgi:hypothetical protein